MIHRPAVLILTISVLFLTSCDSSSSNSGSRLGRAFAALSGDRQTETALFFAKNINLLQLLHSSNADMRWQLKNIWTGTKSSTKQLQLTLDVADKALENLDVATRLCGNLPNTSIFRESIVLLDQVWKQQIVNAQLSLNNSQHLHKVRQQLQQLVKQSNQFTKAIIDSTARLTQLRSNKENTVVSHFLTYILSKSAEQERIIQLLLSSNVMNEQQLKKMMRNRTNIKRILRGMFRGDSRANMKIILDPKRRKIVSELQKQFAQQDYLALASAYEKLLEQNLNEANTTVNFEQTQELINNSVDIANALIEEGHHCS